MKYQDITFDEFYELQDPLLDAPYRGAFQIPMDMYELIVTGQVELPQAVPVHRAMGSEPWDVIWGGGVSLLAVSKRIIDMFHERQFSGWKSFPVEIHDVDTMPDENYRGLAVTGRCGPIDYGKSRLIDEGTAFADYVGLYFDLQTWDGTDFFFSDRGRPFVVSRVKNALEELGVRNISFVPVSMVRTPQLAVDGI